MTDSLDMLMSGVTRQASMGRRAAPSVVPPSPSSSSASASRASYANAAPSPVARKESYGAYGQAQASPSSYSSRGGQEYSYHEKATSQQPYVYEKEVRAPPQQQQQYEQGKSSSQQQQLTSPSSSNSSGGGAVDWAAFKKPAAAARVGSASASLTQQQANTPFSPSNGPKSAAAGLSDQYIASRAAQQQQQQQQQPQRSPSSSPQKQEPVQQKTDDTVISGAVIAPLKTMQQPQQSPQSTPVKRNPFASPPAGSPVAASPFATATSTLSRPNSLASPTNGNGGVSAAAVIESGGGVRAVLTVPCPDCGRNFKRGSLMKHAKVCKKVFGAPSRAQFDSARVRTQALGIDEAEDGDDDGEEERPRTAAYVRPTTAGVRKPLPGKTEESKEQSSSSQSGEPAKWKQSSEGLREAMRRAKKEKAVFAQSSALGIDMRSMMMKR